MNNWKVMKKYFAVLFVAIMAFACAKEENGNLNENHKSSVKTIVLNASSDVITKMSVARVGETESVSWASGDKIGVRMYRYSWGDQSKNGTFAFTLSSAPGSLTGSFEYTGEIEEPNGEGYGGHRWDVGALYPIVGDGATESNFGDGGAYFNMRSSYEYTSGKLLMPLLADMSGGDVRPNSAAFRQIAGAIKIQLANIPPEANKISLSIDGKTIIGWTKAIAPADGVITTSSFQSANNDAPVSFTFSRGASESDYRNMTFYFPVPTVDAPKLRIKLYSDDTVIWNKHTKAQPNITAGKILCLPELDLDGEFYYAYVKDDTGSRWPGSDKAVCVGSVDSWPGSKSYFSETVSGNSYKRFILPYNSAGDGRVLYFNNNYNTSASEIALPAVDISAGTKDYYFRADGLYAAIVDPASLSALTTQKRIWACIGSVSDLRMHVWGGASFDTGAWAWGNMAGMTASNAKLDGKTWFYYNIPDEDNDTKPNIIFVWNSASNQTNDINNVALSSSVYYKINGDRNHESVSW